jgi:hypothetical protein
MQIKITTKDHLTLVRVAIIKMSKSKIFARVFPEGAGQQRFTPVILAIWEIESWRIAVVG